MKPASLGAEPPAFIQPPASSDTEPQLIRAARRAIGSAALLLTATGSPLLTIATERHRSGPRTRILCWSDMFELRAEIADCFFADPELRDALATLKGSGGEIALQLSRRWPANAVPRVIGVVTDGIGMAVSGGHPSALSSDWLTDHVTHRARVSMLIPFGENGRRALLARSASAQMLQ